MEFYKNIEEARVDFNTKDKLNIKIDKKFLELMNQGLTLKIDSEYDRINYYNKDDNNRILSIDLRNKYVCFSGYFWSKFESDLNYQQIKVFLNGMVDKHLNCKEFTTIIKLLLLQGGVDKHLNCKGFTTPWL